MAHDEKKLIASAEAYATRLQEAGEAGDDAEIARISNELPLAEARIIAGTLAYLYYGLPIEGD